MKTYAETSGEQPFDWNQWLKRAIKREPDEEERYSASRKAGLWTTCAVGNACSTLPRNETGEPKDPKLMGLGARFNHHIKLKEWREAKSTLKEIEARSSFLLAQMEAAK